MFYYVCTSSAVGQGFIQFLWLNVYSLSEDLCTHFGVSFCAEVASIESISHFPPMPHWRLGHLTICLAPVDLHLSYPGAQQKRLHISRNKLYAKVHLQASCIKIHPHWCLANRLLNAVWIISPILVCHSYHSCLIKSILSIISYAIYRAWCFQLNNFSCDDRENTRTWYHHLIRSKVWIISRCLWLGHETMVRFMSIFLYNWPVDSILGVDMILWITPFLLQRRHVHHVASNYRQLGYFVQQFV